MLEGQVGKAALVIGVGFVPAIFQNCARGVPGQGIRGKSARIPAEHVARELIEKDDEREAAARFMPPLIQLAAQGLFVEGEEALPDLGVESLALREPALGVLPEPEREHLGRIHRLQ